MHCVRDTWGADLHPELKVVGDRIRKATGPADGYSGFSVEHLPSGDRRGTGLDDLLRSRAIERLVIVGRATLLLDTYDMETAAYRVAELADELRRDHALPSTVRLDSGDLDALAREVRRILDDGDLGDDGELNRSYPGDYCEVRPRHSR